MEHLPTAAVQGHAPHTGRVSPDWTSVKNNVTNIGSSTVTHCKMLIMGNCQGEVWKLHCPINFL